MFGKKRVLVRADLEWEGKDSPREAVARQLVEYLRKNGTERIKLVGHKGNIEMSGELGVDMNWDLRADPREEANDPALAEELGREFDMYVNEAFAVSHREHASIVGVPSLLPHYAGLHLQKEVEELSKILENPKRPLTAIIAGAKIETKLPLIEKMHHFADSVLVGGELAEHDKELISVQHEKISGQKSVVLVADLLENQKD